MLALNSRCLRIEPVELSSTLPGSAAALSLQSRHDALSLEQVLCPAVPALHCLQHHLARPWHYRRRHALTLVPPPAPRIQPLLYSNEPGCLPSTWGAIKSGARKIYIFCYYCTSRGLPPRRPHSMRTAPAQGAICTSQYVRATSAAPSMTPPPRNVPHHTSAHLNAVLVCRGQAAIRRHLRVRTSSRTARPMRRRTKLGEQAARSDSLHVIPSWAQRHISRSLTIEDLTRTSYSRNTRLRPPAPKSTATAMHQRSHGRRRRTHVPPHRQVAWLVFQHETGHERESGNAGGDAPRGT